MKVKKKWKKYVHQIALACLLICCIATYVPQTVKADTKKKKISIVPSTTMVKPSDEDMDDKHQPLPFLLSQSSSPVYCFAVTDGSSSPEWYFISKEKFSIDYYSTNGEADNKPRESSFCSKDGVYGNGYGDFYYLSFGNFGFIDSVWYSEFDGFYYDLDLRAVTDDLIEGKGVAKSLMVFAKFLYTDEWTNGGMDFIGDDHANGSDDAEGGVNNPIEDSEIGTIEISGKAYAQDATANSDNIDEQFYTKWNWKNKTSTGFSLTKNKYHMTRIQVMVESRCLVYSDIKHKTVKEKFQNYGERNKLKNGILPTDKPHTIYLKDVMSALPKTKSEFHNVLFCGYNFKYYWRVMCNDSPTGTGKWYCGGWRAVDLNQDSNKSKDINDTNNGHFDDDGNWVKDEDDGHNNTTDFSDDISGQNPDDANDTITNPKKDTDDKFGWDDFKNLINECRQVPGLIKSVFSFLPDWVLVFIAIGFGIWIFVLIKRAIV